MFAVPDSFASFADAAVFLDSLSEVDRALLGKVAWAAFDLKVDSVLSGSHYGSVSRAMFEKLTNDQGSDRASRAADKLFAELTIPDSSWNLFSRIAVTHVAFGVAASAGLAQWGVLLSPFRVVAAVPVDWRPTVLAAAGNLGLTAAFALPTLVTSESS